MEGILEAGLEVSFVKLNISVTQNSRSFAIPRTDQHEFEVLGWIDNLVVLDLTKQT